jgi:putative exosortase-associated protein (TIGR04073 family)
MRKSFALLASFSLLSLFFAGCASSDLAGPERKFGRGLNNLTEFARGGEMRRSLEQSGVFHGSASTTTGFFHGFNRSVARTFVGAWEVVTFPIPNGPGKSFDPLYMPENPVYPASYKPGLMADQTVATDVNLGFSGGDVFPMIPGSRFKVFDSH